MCDSLAGPFVPFCQPVNGSQFFTRSTVNVTWDPRFFGSPDILLQFGATFTALKAGDPLGKQGFITTDINAGDGFYEWEILDSYVPDGQHVLAALDLSVSASIGGAGALLRGPVVELVKSPASGSNVVVIVVPIVVGVTVLGVLLGLFIFRRRRRNPDFSLRSLVPKIPGIGGSGGYGSKKSVRERMGDTGAVLVGPVVYNNETIIPRDGQNLFREELQRQEMGRI